MDLTGENQHGFKKERSTTSAALQLQSLISRALDENNYYVLSSIDLSSAFDIVNLELLFKRMEIFGMPDDVMQLIKSWLNNRLFYVECGGHTSTIHEDKHGTIQESVLGPVLFCLFIRPLLELEDLITYADDNYIGEMNENLEIAISNIVTKNERIMKWMACSGLKVNDSKTEICIFHRTQSRSAVITINNTTLTSSTTINILGITFDCNLKWNQQYTKTIKEANANLYAIKRIAKFFTKEERTNLVTSLFFSKLYYGSEVWHLPDRTTAQNKMIKLASANALRIISNEITIYHTHTEIHKMTKRAMPDQIIQYKHALMMYNLFRKCVPDNEFIHLNFQANQNQRLQHHAFLRRQNYNVGNNILLNRMCNLNNNILKSMTNQSYLTYKLKCKEMFLKI